MSYSWCTARVCQALSVVMDINPKVQDEYMIPIENLMNPRALDFHAQSNFIYFAAATSYLIGRQKIDGTERDIILKEGACFLFPICLITMIINVVLPYSVIILTYFLFFRYSHCRRNRCGLDGQ